MPLAVLLFNCASMALKKLSVPCASNHEQLITQKPQKRTPTTYCEIPTPTPNLPHFTPIWLNSPWTTTIAIAWIRMVKLNDGTLKLFLIDIIKNFLSDVIDFLGDLIGVLGDLGVFLHHDF